MSRSVVTPSTGKPNYGPKKKPPKIWKGGPKPGPKHYGQGGKKPNPTTGSNDPGAHKKGGKGRSGGSGGGAYGAYGDYEGVRYGEAASLVNAGLKPEIHQVQNDIQKTRRETQRERQRAKRQYNAAVGDIGHIFGESGDYINYQNQQMDQLAGQTMDQTQAAQAALMQHLSGTGQAAMGDVNAETERLGIQGMNYTAPMQQDQAFTTEQAQISGANNVANLNLSHQNSQELGSLLQGMNTGSQTAAYGRAANAKSEALFEAQANKHTAVEQLKRSLADLRGQRPDLIRQMLEQMQQSRWGQYMDTQNLDLQEEQLDLQRAAQRAYAKQSAAYNSRYSSGGGDYSSSDSGSGTGDGGSSTTKSGSGRPGTGVSDEIYNLMNKKPPKPKPGPKRKPKPGSKP
jgi:hypothetical protein